MLKQQQTLQQTQKLSPQQIQVIRMLELPVIELEERVKQELQENPTLEEGPEAEQTVDRESNAEETTDSFASAEEISLGDYRNEDDIPDYKLQSSNREQQERQPESNYTRPSSLHDFLQEQIALRSMPEEEAAAAHYIIGNLDNNGYLSRSLQAIEDDILITTGIELPADMLQDALMQVQELDPAGVGAQSLQECLLLQLERKRATPAATLAYQILDQAFDAFSKRHFDQLQKQFQISEQELKEALLEITSLNPKPGSAFDDFIESKMEQIIPDFLVENMDGELLLTLNNSNIPSLHVSRTYQEMFEDYNNHPNNQSASQKQAVMYVKQKLDAARSFISALSMRNQTLEATMRCIMERQRDFFLTGDERALRPMILKDIAEPTGYDISTISRVSNSKYVQTDYGIFPLKFFFSEGTQTNEGETITTREVKKLLATLIEQEDKQQPLSDDKLCEQLKEKGYNIARRTVAKYREQLNLPVARLRKEL